MAKCAYCGSTILFGGKRAGDLRFCGDGCYKNAGLIAVTNQIPPEVVEELVLSTHSGNCPKCQGPGPVDVHTSYRIWSALVVTSWANRPQVCCSSCGRKAKIGDACISLLLGWWGVPWGFIMTPIQIGRNLGGLLGTPESDQPSEQLRTILTMQLAANCLSAQAQDQPGVPPTSE